MQKICKQFVVYDAGLVVNPAFPYVGGSPDGKVYDPTEQEPHGLLEIKCLYVWRNNTMEEACAQVQGRLGVLGLQWYDFVIHLTESHILNVERIYFNKLYWEQDLLPKLHQFYFTLALPRLAKLSAS